MGNTSTVSKSPPKISNEKKKKKNNNNNNLGQTRVTLE